MEPSNYLNSVPGRGELLSTSSELPPVTIEFEKIQKLVVLFQLDLGNRKLGELPSAIGSLDVTELKLNSNYLSRLPDSIGSIERLRELHIHNNRLDELPDTLGALKNLEKLYLIGNRIKRLPESIGSLINLTRLHLTSNRLEELPDSIGFMTKLNWLELGYNRLSILPGSMGSLKSLETLNLASNKFIDFPESISSCTNLLNLDMRQNGLLELPNSVGHLVELRFLHLQNNQLGALPESIGSLINLSNLELEYNHLQTLPEGIGSATKLSTLYLTANQVSRLPNSIGMMSSLNRLDLSDNQLVSLPESMGGLQSLFSLNLMNNPNLRELPLTLGECSGLTHINIENTSISDDVLGAIEDMCYAVRHENVDDTLPARLELWENYAKSENRRDYDLTFINYLDASKRTTINEWLLRLSKAKDFELNQVELANTACSMLQDLENNGEWFRIFFLQVDANNTACEDRAAQAFNELYVAWRLHQLDDKTPIQGKLNLFASAAKTVALRKLIAAKLAGRNEGESVEIYLYYESTLQHELGLLTAIKNMRYSLIGKRDWINVEELRRGVEDAFLEEMASMDAISKMAGNNESFREEHQQMLASMHEKLNNFKGSEGEYKEHCDQVMKEKEKDEKVLLVNWVKAQMQSASRGFHAEQA